MSIGFRSDNGSEAAVNGGIGKRIRAVFVTDKVASLRFEGGITLRLWDDAQSCCERRYMTCDDNLSYYEGAELLSVAVQDGPMVEGDCEAHDQQFLVVTTSKGAFTIANHNEHNGYYGGFAIEASLEEQT